MPKTQYIERDKYGNVILTVVLFEDFGVIDESVDETLESYKKSKQYLTKFLEINEHFYDNKNNLILTSTKQKENGKLLFASIEKYNYTYDEYDNITEKTATYYHSEKEFTLADTRDVNINTVTIKYENIYEDGLLTEVRCVTCKSNEPNNDISRRLNYKDGLLQSVMYNNGNVDTYNYENNKLKSVNYTYGDKRNNDVYKTMYDYKNDRIHKEKNYFNNDVLKEVVQYNYFEDGCIVKETKGPSGDGFDWCISDPIEYNYIHCTINEEVLTPSIIESVVDYLMANYKKTKDISMFRGCEKFLTDFWTFEKLNDEMIDKLSKKYNITIYVELFL